MFKKTFVAAAFVTAIAAPAFAQSFDYWDGTGNVLPFAYESTGNGGNDAYAQAAPTAKHSTKMANAHRSAKSAYAQAAPAVRHTSKTRYETESDFGIFENLPAGVTDPYAYHNELMRLP